MNGSVCIVLAGGLGTRLGDVLQGRPKCLAPVGTRSFLDIQLQALATRGVERFVLSLGHAADQVVAEARRLRERHRIDWTIEPGPLGTGGGLLLAMQEWGLGEALVANGDTFLSGDLAPLLPRLDVAGGERMRMATVAVEDRRRFGGLVMAAGHVVDFLDKGAAGPGPINAGLYRVARDVFAAHRPGQAFSLERDVMPRLAAEHGLTACAMSGRFIDIGVPDDYFRFCRTHGDE